MKSTLARYCFSYLLGFLLILCLFPSLLNAQTITYSGTNVGIGSLAPGQTLDVQGTVQALGYVNSLSFVASSSLSSASSVTFNNLSPGVIYKLVLNLIQNTSNGSQELQVNGDTGNNYTSNVLVGVNSFAGANLLTSNYFQLTYSNTTFSSNYSQFDITFQTVPGNNNAVQYTSIGGNYGSSLTTYLVNLAYGVYTGSSALSSITFSTSAGTVSGTAKLYKYN